VPQLRWRALLLERQSPAHSRSNSQLMSLALRIAATSCHRMLRLGCGRAAAGGRALGTSAELDEAARADPDSHSPWRGARYYWNGGKDHETPVASQFWIQPFAERPCLVTVCRSRRMLNQWVARHILRGARGRRLWAEQAGLAAAVYSSPAPSQALGLGRQCPLGGGASEVAPFFLDHAHVRRLQLTAELGAGESPPRDAAPIVSSLVRAPPRDGLRESALERAEHAQAASCCRELSDRLELEQGVSWKFRGIERTWSQRTAVAELDRAAPWRLRGELDPQHAVMLDRIRWSDSQEVVGFDAEWSTFPPNVRVGDYESFVDRDHDSQRGWGTGSPGRHGMRVPGSADVVQFATHNAVLVASLTQ
jgi:hypothetical protein